MRIAWFRDTAPDLADPLDDTAPLIDELRSAHEIDVIVEQTAHDFVWQHILRPWDLCVFELDNTRAHQFVSGVPPQLRGRRLPSKCGRRDSCRVALLASRSVGRLASRLFAESLQRALSRGARQICACHAGGRHAARPDALQRIRRGARRLTRPAVDEVRCRSIAGARARHRRSRRSARWRCGRRLRCAGGGRGAERVDSLRCRRSLQAGRLIDGPPTAVLAAMAAGKAVVTMEMEATAEWPALDPQTWRPRGLSVQRTRRSPSRSIRATRSIR